MRVLETSPESPVDWRYDVTTQTIREDVSAYIPTEGTPVLVAGGVGAVGGWVGERGDSSTTILSTSNTHWLHPLHGLLHVHVLHRPRPIPRSASAQARRERMDSVSRSASSAAERKISTDFDMSMIGGAVRLVPAVAPVRVASGATCTTRWGAGTSTAAYSAGFSADTNGPGDGGWRSI